MTYLLDGVYCTAGRNFLADFVDSVREDFPVLCIDNRLNRRSKDRNAVLFEHTHPIEFNPAVQAGLTTEGQQNSVRALRVNHLQNKSDF